MSIILKKANKVSQSRGVNTFASNKIKINMDPIDDDLSENSNNTNNTNNTDNADNTDNINNRSVFKSVSDLNNSVKNELQKSFSKAITVTGELSNYKVSNKNMYATLKDNDACISIIFWGFEYKKKNLTFANGDIVTVTGSISVYTKSGSYCVQLTDIKKTGKQVGNVHTQYELLKQKYNDLGYFINKKPIPNTIKCLGIVTALEGAALQDIMYVLKKNNFAAKVIIKGCMVQGNQSVSSIVKGIETLSSTECDIILITRGGGSYEDLISYSSEEVIEAIHKCPKFTISAVGHEIDFMLSDFVADLRAPTPSVAAEIICNIKRKSFEEFSVVQKFIEQNMLNKIQCKLQIMLDELNVLKIKLYETANKNKNDEINKVKKILENKMNARIYSLNNELKDLQDILSKFDMTKNMEDGYAVIIKGNSTVIDSVSNIKSGQKLKIKMKDGEINVIVV